MFTVSNFLSLLRAPLAFFFLSSDIYYRIFAIVVAMITDSLDGYYARRFRATSQIGAILDPLMDKFFVLFALSIFIQEEQITPIQVLTFLCRDFSVLLFGIYLAFRGQWHEYQFRSIWCGKITTTLQFFVLISLTFQQPLPNFIFPLFVVLGFFALIELYLIHRDVRQAQSEKL